MKTSILAFALISSVALFSQAAEAKGCLKGAAVGGVAGHVAGKHGVVGAAAGCAIGRHQANKKIKEAQTAQTQAQSSTAAQKPAQ